MGTVIGQIIAISLLPFIAKIYSPEAIGRAASTLALLNIISLIIFFQYDHAIIVAKKEDIPYLLFLCTISVTFWLCVIGILDYGTRIYWNKAHTILTSIGFNTYLLLLIPCYSYFLLLVNLKLRTNQIISVSVARVIYYGGNAILQVLFGFYFDSNERNYLLAQIIGTFTAVMMIFPYQDTFRWIKNNNIKELNIPTKMIEMISYYRNFPRYQLGAQLFNSISHQLPILILRVGFSDTWAGWYFVAWRALAAPSTLLSQAIGQVYYRDSAEIERVGGKQARPFENVVYNLFKMSFLPSMILWIFTPYVVDWFLGDEWLTVAVIIRILLFSMVISFFVSPISPVLNVKGKQKAALGFNLLLLIGRGLFLLLGLYFGSELFALWGYSLVTVIIMFLFFMYIKSILNSNMTNVVKRSKSYILGAVSILVSSIILFSIDQLYTPIGVIAIIGLFLVFLFSDLTSHFETQRS